RSSSSLPAACQPPEQADAAMRPGAQSRGEVGLPPPCLVSASPIGARPLGRAVRGRKFVGLLAPRRSARCPAVLAISGVGTFRADALHRPARLLTRRMNRSLREGSVKDL